MEEIPVLGMIEPQSDRDHWKGDGTVGWA